METKNLEKISETKNYKVLAVKKEGCENLIVYQPSIDKIYSENAQIFIDAFKAEKGDLIFDIGSINYMDSSGLASVLRGLNIQRNKQKHFGICNATNKEVSAFFEITGLDKIFETWNLNLEEAIEDYKQKK